MFTGNTQRKKKPRTSLLFVVRTLGAFHGNMFALKLTKPRMFNGIKNELPEISDHEMRNEKRIFIHLCIRRAMNNVRASNNNRIIVPEPFLKRLEKLLYGTCTYLCKRSKPIEPFAVIGHGDYLRNNIAFRYESDGNPSESMTCDFQTLRYASPMLDLVVFMANSTGYEVRNKHFSDIFSAYHESLIATFDGK